MYYSDEIIEDVRSKNDIVDVIGNYIKLEKRGSSHIGHCPFHGEKTPSFHVSRAKQMFHCFGCGEGGSVYGFVMKYENLTFPEAIKVLADKAGIALPEETYSEDAKKEIYHKKRLYEINKESATFYFKMLRGEKGKLGLDYFYSRKLEKETMRSFGLGYAGQGGYNLTKHLQALGYKQQEIIDAGIAVYDEKSGLHDKFWNRVIFPIWDVNNKVIGFGGRVMGDAKPKYLNSPETIIFNKSKNLYALNFARSSRANFILCEGYLDVIAMHQAGFKQAVASLGTAFTDGQARLIKKYTDEVIIAYDSDEAGIKATNRCVDILKAVGINAKVLNLQPYKDPDELIKEKGVEEMQKRIDNAENSFFFWVGILARNYDLNKPDEKTSFCEKIAKKLCTIKMELERDNYLNAIAVKYYILPNLLRKMVIAYANIDSPDKENIVPKILNNKKKKIEDGPLKIQRMLLTWIIEEPVIYGKIKKYISEKDFTDEIYNQVAKMLFDSIEKEDYSPAKIISKFADGDTQKIVSEIFHTKLEGIESIAEKEKALKDLVLSIKNNSYSYYSGMDGADNLSLENIIKGKKILEEIARANFLLT